MIRSGGTLTLLVWLLSVCMTPGPALAEGGELLERVAHGYADSDGVRIHYATLGEGPLVVLLHGFPDYWYTWRHLMERLAPRYQVVALDLRGYNLSDQPKEVSDYSMRKLMGDVAAVIRHLGRERATIIGHDWGAGISWQFAMWYPQMVENLVILSVPHPSGLRRALSENAEQKKNSQYARDYQKEGAHQSLTAEGLASWVKDPQAKKHYIEAFQRSSFEGMLNYYKASYPRPAKAVAKPTVAKAGGGGAPSSDQKAGGSPVPAATETSAPAPRPKLRKIQAPVLIFHGLEDKALHASGHNDTWEWLEKDLTLVMIPGAGHFVQHDATEQVNRTIEWWLRR